MAFGCLSRAGGGSWLWVDQLLALLPLAFLPRQALLLPDLRALMLLLLPLHLLRKRPLLRLLPLQLLQPQNPSLSE